MMVCGTETPTPMRRGAATATTSPAMLSTPRPRSSTPCSTMSAPGRSCLERATRRSCVGILVDGIPRQSRPRGLLRRSRGLSTAENGQAGRCLWSASTEPGFRRPRRQQPRHSQVLGGRASTEPGSVAPGDPPGVLEAERDAAASTEPGSVDPGDGSRITVEFSSMFGGDRERSAYVGFDEARVAVRFGSKVPNCRMYPLASASVGSAHHLSARHQIVGP